MIDIEVTREWYRSENAATRLLDEARRSYCGKVQEQFGFRHEWYLPVVSFDLRAFKGTCWSIQTDHHWPEKPFCKKLPKNPTRLDIWKAADELLSLEMERQGRSGSWAVSSVEISLGDDRVLIMGWDT